MSDEQQEPQPRRPDFSRPGTTIKARVEKGEKAMVGPYRLLQELGSGGMGTVYLAEQKVPVRRKVALKLIRSGMNTRQVVARFEAERQALALMEHPNIARVLDAGTTEDGAPYFVMELVHGRPMTKFCDENEMTTRERLNLFTKVCRAVHHAHQRGIIHRDIKPSNVLVTMSDGEPMPKIIDFGVAKAIEQDLTEKTMFTQHGQIIGTLEYMSPEQADMNPADVDIRSDIYSLGVLLYELMTGTTPITLNEINERGLAEVLKWIREVDPPKPSTRISESRELLPTLSARRRTEPKKLGLLLRGDLDWVVMKAMDKNRGRRYQSAFEFGADVKRFLEGHAVEACPPSAGYKFKKLVRRHKVAAAFISLLSVLLVVIVVGSAWAALHFRKQEVEQRSLREQADRLTVQAEEALDEVALERDRAFRNRYLADMRAAEDDAATGNVPRLYRTLGKYLPEKGRPDLRGWEWHYLLAETRKDLKTLRAHHYGISQVAWHPSGTRLASLEGSRKLVIWDTSTWEIIRTVPDVFSTYFAWNHRGDRLALVERPGVLQIRDAETLLVQRTFEIPSTLEPYALAFSPNDTYLLAHYPEHLLICDFGLPGSSPIIKRAFKQQQDVVWRPDSRAIITDQYVFELKSGRKTMHPELSRAMAGQVTCLALSPDGRRIASGGNSGEITVNEVETGRRLGRIETRGSVGDLDWSPDGRYIAAGNQGPSVLILDADTLETKATYHGHNGLIRSVAWHPDGRTLASAGEDGLVKIWSESGDEVSRSNRIGEEHRWLRGRSRPVPQINAPAMAAPASVSPDGRLIAGSMLYNRFLLEEHQLGAGIWRADTGELLFALGGHTVGRPLSAPVWSPDGAWLATGGWDAHINIWNPSTGDLHKQLLAHNSRIAAFTLSPDNTRMATRETSGTIKIWDFETEQPVLEIPAAGAGQLAWSRDGRILMDLAETNRYWDASRGYGLEHMDELKDDLKRLARIDRTSRMDAADQFSLLLNLTRAAGPYLQPHIIDVEEWETLLNRAEAIKPDHPELPMERGLQMIFREEWEEALATFEGVGSPHDKWFTTLIGRAIALYGLGRRDEGHRVAEEAHAVMKASEKPEIFKANLMKQLEIARKGNPGPDELHDEDLLTWRGVMLAGQGRWEDAGADLSRIHQIKEDPSFLMVYVMNWFTIGPYPGDIEQAFPPENDPDPFSRYEEGPRRWWPSENNQRMIRLGEATNVCYYVLNRLWSAKDDTVTLAWGCREPSRVYLGDQLL
ncbi:MAG: protein kinase, partial [Verrucomicrobiota bacterium]